MKYLAVFFIFAINCTVSAQTLIGVLHKDVGIPELHSVIEPLFQLNQKKWSPIQKNECEKITINEWQILFDGKALAKMKTMPLKTEFQKAHCYFEISPSLKIPKNEMIVGTIPNNAADPSQWKPMKVSNGELSLLGISKLGKVLKAYRNKQGDRFLVLHMNSKLKDDEIGSTLSGIWNSKNKKVWSTEATIVELVDAGDYDSDGQSELVILQGEFGGGVTYSLFSSKYEILAETSH